LSEDWGYNIGSFVDLSSEQRVSGEEQEEAEKQPMSSSSKAEKQPMSSSKAEKQPMSSSSKAEKQPMSPQLSSSKSSSKEQDECRTSSSLLLRNKVSHRRRIDEAIGEVETTQRRVFERQLSKRATLERARCQRSLESIPE